jgi:hypothetical protein
MQYLARKFSLAFSNHPSLLAGYVPEAQFAGCKKYDTDAVPSLGVQIDGAPTTNGVVVRVRRDD